MEPLFFYEFKHNSRNKDMALSKYRKRANAAKNFKKFAANHRNYKRK